MNRFVESVSAKNAETRRFWPGFCGTLTISDVYMSTCYFRQTERISKYFLHETTHSVDSKNVLEEPNKTQSPYGQFTSKMSPVLNNSIDENYEFKTPKPFKRPARKLDLGQPPTHASKNKGKNVASKGRNRAGRDKNQRLPPPKMISDAGAGDINREHLETALALSISDVCGSGRREERKEIDTHVISCEKRSEVDIVSTQEKVANVRKTLEEFGFTNRSERAAGTLRGVRDLELCSYFPKFFVSTSITYYT